MLDVSPTITASHTQSSKQMKGEIDDGTISKSHGRTREVRGEPCTSGAAVTEGRVGFVGEFLTHTNPENATGAPKKTTGDRSTLTSPRTFGPAVEASAKRRATSRTILLVSKSLLHLPEPALSDLLISFGHSSSAARPFPPSSLLPLVVAFDITLHNGFRNHIHPGSCLDFAVKQHQPAQRQHHSLLCPQQSIEPYPHPPALPPQDEMFRLRSAAQGRPGHARL